nr:transposase, MuDR, MULE transposase domain protein [Tanacetum cinerariifolium]
MLINIREIQRLRVQQLFDSIRIGFALGIYGSGEVAKPSIMFLTLEILLDSRPKKDSKFHSLYKAIDNIYGAHLRGTYQGTNLLAVGMDGNNHILPTTTGVSQGETGASWTWFLGRLKECIGEVPDMCIISDRHPLIILNCKTGSNN